MEGGREGCGQCVNLLYPFPPFLPSAPPSVLPSLSHFPFLPSLPPSLLPSLPPSLPQVADLQKKSADLKNIVEDSCILAEGLVSERIAKQQYLNDEKKNTSRMQRLQQDMDTIVKTL